MLLVTPADGWMIGNSRLGEKELFVTHDGTKSWHRVSVDTPKDVLPASFVKYYWLPTFEDSRRGFLQVNYSGRIGVKPAAVLFATRDGGRTWKLDRMVTSEYRSAGYGMPTVVDSAWVWVTVLDHGPKLTTVGTGERVRVGADAAMGALRHTAAGPLSFATPTNGWVIVGDGDLLSTTDSGATWSDISPGPKPHVIHPVESPSRRPVPASQEP